MKAQLPPLRCFRCGRRPEELECYRLANLGSEDGQPIYPTVAEYVWMEEGTLDRRTGHFACDDCYIAIGTPAGRGGTRWTAP